MRINYHDNYYNYFHRHYIILYYINVGVTENTYNCRVGHLYLTIMNARRLSLLSITTKIIYTFIKTSLETK